MSLRIPKPIDGWDEKVMADMPTEAGICPSPVNGILFGLNRYDKSRGSLYKRKFAIRGGKSDQDDRRLRKVNSDDATR